MFNFTELLHEKGQKILKGALKKLFSSLTGEEMIEILGGKNKIDDFILEIIEILDEDQKLRIKHKFFGTEDWLALQISINEKKEKIRNTKAKLT